MKQLLILSVLFILTFSAVGQTFERQAAETAEQFIKRITKVNNLPHPVIETKEWNNSRKVIIYFVHDTTTGEGSITGYLLVPAEGSLYQRILIEHFYPEGGATNIEAVFFANADGDKEREIFILTSWPQNHGGAGIDGVLYGTNIYEAPNLSAPQKRLTCYKELSQRLDGGFEGRQEGKTIVAKYKTVGSLRAELKQMGY